MMLCPVLAEDNTGTRKVNSPVEVEIPVKVEGPIETEVTIESDDSEAMKALITDSTIHVKDNGKFVFETNEPADFKYTIRQKKGTDKYNGNKVNYSTDVYTAHVFVEATDDGLVPSAVVWKNSDTTKSDSVTFKNSIEKKANGVFNTASDLNLVPSLFITILALVGIFVSRPRKDKA